MNSWHFPAWGLGMTCQPQLNGSIYKCSICWHPNAIQQHWVPRSSALLEMLNKSIQDKKTVFFMIIYSVNKYYIKGLRDEWNINRLTILPNFKHTWSICISQVMNYCWKMHGGGQQVDLLKNWKLGLISELSHEEAEPTICQIKGKLSQGTRWPISLKRK